jgi:hypothetical protein
MCMRHQPKLTIATETELRNWRYAPTAGLWTICHGNDQPVDKFDKLLLRGCVSSEKENDRKQIVFFGWKEARWGDPVGPDL